MGNESARDQLDKKDQLIKKLQDEVSRLQGLVNTDELTQILNRRGLMAYLAAIGREVAYQLNNPNSRRSVIVQSLSLIMIDIDHFKSINDHYGHQAGDAVLKSVAKLINEMVRGIDIVGRYGGEEIIVGLVGADGPNALRIAEDLRQRIAHERFKYKNHTIEVTVSMGVSTLSQSQRLDELIAEADHAVYQAKKRGRNNVVVFTEENN